MRLGWFSSGRGPGSRNLLNAVLDEKRNMDVSIEFIFCNWDNTETPNPKKDERELFFNIARENGIPVVTLSWKTFRPDLKEKDEAEWRNEYGREMRRLLSPYKFDIGILAGYMLWVDDDTCMEYDLLNLHPALPDGPKGTWQEVIWELIENGAEEQGSMMHMCTPEWDRGEAITFCGFPIRGDGYDELWTISQEQTDECGMEPLKTMGTDGPLFRKIREDGAKRELPLVVSTISRFADGTITIRDKQLYHKGERMNGPFDLSEDVNKRINNG